MPLQPLAGDSPVTPHETGVTLPVPLLVCRHYVVACLDAFPDFSSLP